MSIKSKVCAIGPSLVLGVNGQNKHFDWVSNDLIECDKVYYSFYQNKIIDGIKLTLTLIQKRLSKHSYQLIYFTPSRTKTGLIRDLLIFYILKNKKNKFISHIHGSEIEEFYESLNPIERIIATKLYSSISLNIVLCDDVGEKYKSLLNAKYITIPNAIDFNSTNKKNRNRIKKKILFCSNLFYSKGIIHLLQAIYNLPDELKQQIELEIAGEFMSDEYKTDFQTKRLFFELVKSLISEGISVNYHGKINKERAITLFEQSDIFILPTFYTTEAMPLSILEALAYKNIIITSDWRYLKSIFVDYSIFYVEKENIASIKRQIEEILNLELDSVKEIVDTNHELFIRNNNKSITKLKNVLQESTY